ncbi:hypothetical protein BV882_39625 [Streptomyces sp. 46]|nr:hypothetical protein BV882_39625 [Streptomyces sp. 46]
MLDGQHSNDAIAVGCLAQLLILDLQDVYDPHQLLDVCAQLVALGTQAGDLRLQLVVGPLQAVDDLRPRVLHPHQGVEQVLQARLTAYAATWNRLWDPPPPQGCSPPAEPS